ncbi:MAG: isocitrate lyase/phosphoenolpyruvate mutase family protein [Rhodospirillales bacterium]
MTQPDRSAEEKADVFRALHHAPDILVLPNAWDVTSAMLLEQADFAAIATTSAGIGYTFGYPIGQKMPRRDMLGVLERITARIACPLTADMEAGYGDTPEEVAETVRLTWAAGAVGINLEDRTYEADAPLIEVSPAAARIEAARGAAPSMVINARTDGYFIGGGGADVFADTVRRANLFRRAGADCIFVPGIKDAETIGRLAAEIDAPLNIMAGPGYPDVAALAALGVKRVTVGAHMARAAYATLEHAAAELKTSGTYGFADHGPSHAAMNDALSR